MKIKQVEGKDVIELLANGVKVNRVNRNGIAGPLCNRSIQEIRTMIESGKYAFFVINEESIDEQCN